MRVYVAGGSSERLTVVRPFIDRLLAAGVTVTHDWTRCEGYDQAPIDAQLRGYAQRDLVGVSAADVFWLIAPEDKSEGSASELGAALILGKRVLVSGPMAMALGRIFTLLASEIHRMHETAFEAIVSDAARMMGGAA